MEKKNIINVSENDFEYEVLNYSQNTPVVVDFWATWCRPCKVLEPILEKLVIEGKGVFRLARVDVDENPNLVLRYGVRTIPTVKAISQGQVVGEFVEVQPESRIREFIAKIIPPSPLNLAVEKANSLMDANRWEEAEQIFREVLESEANYPGAMLGIAKAYLAQGKTAESLAVLQAIPPSKQYSKAEILKPLVHALISFQKGDIVADLDLDIYYASCLRLILRKNFAAALDGLLDILKENRHYRNDLARNVFLALLELLGENYPKSARYRAELASILF